MQTKTGFNGRQSVAADIAARLGEAIEALAIDLLGRPDHRNHRELRWGENGRRRVTISGPHRGSFRDFAADDHGGDALDLIRNARGCSTAEALAWGRAWLGDPATHRVIERTPTRDQRAEVEEDIQDRIRRAGRIWTEAKPMQGTIVEVYLRTRGLTLPDNLTAIRFHPRCPRGPFVAPAMVSLLQDVRTGEPCGVHRTYLAPDGSGKADKQAKRMLGRAGGAAIMLTPFEEVTLGLAICEGIETGLALLAQGAAPLWACGSASGIRTFPLLAGVESLTVLADHDPTGIGAAEACAERWQSEGREVFAFVPEINGSDFADLTEMNAA